VSGFDSTATRARRHRLFEQRQPLPTQLDSVRGEPRDVPARPREVGDEPRPYRIPACDNDRDTLRCLAGGSRCRRTPRDDDIHLEPDQFSREVGEPLDLPPGPALLQDDGLALHIAERVQPLQECVTITRGNRQRAPREHPYPGDLW
jgi:hypothetical protein